MAKVDLNALTGHLHGIVGDLVFKRVRGRLQAAMRPKPRTSPPTENQRAHHVVFKRAISHARHAMADPELQPIYQRVAAAQNRSAFTTAVGDYFNPPEVQLVDVSRFAGKSGDKVTIMATDDVEVKAVGMVVRRSDGTVIEEGPASRVFEEWVYILTTAIAAGTSLIFEVTATDWAGNKGMAHKMYP